MKWEDYRDTVAKLLALEPLGDDERLVRQCFDRGDTACTAEECLRRYLRCGVL